MQDCVSVLKTLHQLWYILHCILCFPSSSLWNLIYTVHLYATCTDGSDSGRSAASPHFLCTLFANATIQPCWCFSSIQFQHGSTQLDSAQLFCSRQAPFSITILYLIAAVTVFYMWIKHSGGHGGDGDIAAIYGFMFVCFFRSETEETITDMVSAPCCCSFHCVLISNVLTRET